MVHSPQIANKSKKTNALVFLLIVLGIVVCVNYPVVAEKTASIAVLTKSGVQSSFFCTTTRQVLIVHKCVGPGDNHFSSKVDEERGGSYCSFGQTYISGGPGTFRLAQGNAEIPKGCYSMHGFSNTTVVGRATAISTVWYDQ
jgi:hypothetical protein